MSKILLCIVTTVVLGACSAQSDKARAPGTAPEGYWYTGASDSCTFDGVVYHIDNNTITLNTLNYEAGFFSYIRSTRGQQDQLILTLTSLLESTPEPIIIHFLDQGTQLTPTAAFSITGDPVGLEKISGLFTLTECSDPSWYGALKLLVGIDTSYLPNSKREPMPKPSQ